MRYCGVCDRPIAEGAPCPNCSREKRERLSGQSLERPVREDVASPAEAPRESAPEAGDSHKDPPRPAGSGTRTIEIFGIAIKGALGVCAGIALILAFLSLITLIAYFIGNIQLICLAGLLWLLIEALFLCFADTARSGASWISRSAAWLREWLANRDAAVFVFFSAAVSWIAGKVSRMFFLAMGCIATSAVLTTNFHTKLANIRLNTIDHASVPLSVPVILGLIPPFLGALLDHVNRFREDIQKADSVTAWATYALKSLTMFEFAGSVLILISGLWGPAAFHAADLILHLPADDTMYGVHVGIPVCMFCSERLDAALTLFRVQGLYTYVALFVIVPAIGLARTLSWPPGEARTLRKDRLAAQTFCLCLLVLPITVAYRTGAVLRYGLAAIGRFSDSPQDRTLSSCLVSSSTTESDVACAAGWVAAWEDDWKQTARSIRLALPPESRTRFEQSELRWQRLELATLYVTGPNGSVLPPSSLLRAGRRIRSHVRNLRPPPTPAAP